MFYMYVKLHSFQCDNYFCRVLSYNVINDVQTVTTLLCFYITLFIPILIKQGLL